MTTKVKILDFENFYVILQDRFLKQELFYKPQIMKTDSGLFCIQLDLSSVEFFDREKNIFDLFFLIGKKKHRVLSQTKQLQRKSEYSTNLYKINNADVAVPYLTIKNNLSLLYGNASVVFKEFCTEIASKERMNATVLVKDKFMSIDFNSFPFNKNMSFLAFYDYEQESYVSLRYTLDENNVSKIFIDQSQFPAYETRKYGLVVQQKKRNILVTMNLDITTDVDKVNKAVDDHKFNSLEKPVIKNYISLKHVNYNERRISFEIDDLSTHNFDNYCLFLKDKDGRTFFPKVKYKKIRGVTICEVNLSDFIKKYAKNKSRWRFYFKLEDEHFIEENRLGVYDAPPAPAYQRYFKNQDIEDYHVITPYVSIRNGLSVVITSKVSLHSEILQPVTEVADFKKEKKNIFSGEILLELKECEDYVVESLLLKYRNTLKDAAYFFDISEEKKDKNKSLIKFKIDISNISFEQYYWDILLQIKNNNNKYLVRVKNPPEGLSESINKNDRKYRVKFGDGFILYPHITMNNGLSFIYRQREEYEGIWQQIKEYYAYIIYRLFKNHFDNKQIWLVYEKFAQTAQDNSYYFFKYAYENPHNENVYYVIDKHSSDYGNIKGMKSRVISYMSVKHLVYLFASKLFVSSEAKGHVYILRKQNGRLKNVIHEKKFVFLQHGVLGLKKVNSIFSKNGKSGANLFVTSSEWEKNIVERNFGYNKEDIVVSGLCRWDALIDKSKDSNKKEIMFMPTWRSWLDGVSDDKFISSDYYHNYTALLQSKRLQMILQDNDIIMHFYVHPKFKAYIDKFSTDNKNIKIYQFGEEKINHLLMRNVLLITDYSSVAWDQYYQKKPVIFYQFDHKTYEQLQGSYMDMDTDLFGDRIFDVNQLIHTIEEYINRDFVEKDKYAAMRDKYFQHVDQHNSKRIFKEIINNKKKLNLK